MTARVRLAMSTDPDAFGYFFGDAYTCLADLYRIHYLPPRSEWHGRVEPDELCDQWVIYVDGYERARADNRADCDLITIAAIGSLVPMICP